MADIICRWRNGTPRTVVELVNSLPHSVITVEKFRDFMQSSIWGPDFFRTPYQLACQLGLYCEAEDGYYYPRFDHDINEDEAKDYLEFWITRYYVPNPYVGKNGFKDITCPTYVLYELYTYTKQHKNCTYSDAYESIFQEKPTNNNDIVKNYINNYSKILHFDSNGQLTITDINPNAIFDFMDRNNKKEFFDNFSKRNNISKKQTLLLEQNKLTSFILSTIQFFNKKDGLNAIVPYAGEASPIKIHKENAFNLVGMFLESTLDDVRDRNINHNRWFEEQFALGSRNVFLSTQWSANGDYQLTLEDFIKMIQCCYGTDYIYRTGLNGEHQLYYANNNLQQTDREVEKILPYLTALRTKPFMLLAGISGTGKSRIVRKLAQATTTQKYEKDSDRWNDNRPENFELIQVKPNWHNSMDVVGFYSNISKQYEFTPFVEFIVKAWQHTDTPYFLCLDEMNLAPVEEYFAEFLSAIESRSTDADGNYITDPIIKPFKDFGETVGKGMLKHLFGEADPIDKNPLAVQFYEKGLTLPPNLMVMGTVNMDETTFSFSRKVLDRAMSVEMNEVDYDKFLSGETEEFPLLIDYNELLVNRPQKASEVKDDIDSEKVVEYLKDVNALLEDTPFKLGYRAANEAILYVAANKELAGDQFSMPTALDEFTLMKILSRIEGDDQRLNIDENDPRVAAANIADNVGNGQRINLLTCLCSIVRKHIGDDTQTERKIASMNRTLEREHFVSYWG